MRAALWAAAAISVYSAFLIPSGQAKTLDGDVSLGRDEAVRIFWQFDELENKSGLMLEIIDSRIISITSKKNRTDPVVAEKSLRYFDLRIDIHPSDGERIVLPNFLIRKDGFARCISGGSAILIGNDFLMPEIVMSSADRNLKVLVNVERGAFANILDNKNKTKMHPVLIEYYGACDLGINGDPRTMVGNVGPSVDFVGFSGLGCSIFSGPCSYDIGSFSGQSSALSRERTVYSSLSRLASFAQRPYQEASSNQREENADDCRYYLPISGCSRIGSRVGGLALGGQIIGLMFIGFGFACGVVRGLIWALDDPDRNRRRLGWAVAALCFPLGLTFYGWGWLGHPLAFWTLGGYLTGP